MGLSHHDPDYILMQDAFRSAVKSWWRENNGDYDDLVDHLFCIMNDYGAVEFT